ncbi:MAG: GDP-mannose 4,6-dehydratase, partial [Candidatus Diapherotrites archaeon]|nr:GDP-mannose 4,6-dehydratase [Candidatus Diapherotrites archaeon]
MDRNTLEKKEILVIGGLGFIGSNIVQKLVSRKAKVTIFDACLDPYGWNFANIAEVKDQVAFVKGDTRDLEAVKAAVVGKAAVVDCAAQVSHTISVKNPFLDLDINCRGALNICEALREKNDSAKLVYAGTRGEIGKMVFNPITEDHP